jgi:hypothetical protein
MTGVERVSYWRNVFEQQKASGLSTVAFCRERNIKLAQLYRWCRRFREEDSASAGGFVELVEVSAQAHSGVRIRLDGRIIIDLERGFDPVTLRLVIETVQPAREE